MDRPEFKGASGATLLGRSCPAVYAAAGYEIGNVSVQLIGQRPRVAGRIAQANAALSQAAGADVQMSATTTDT